jgi:hypothetical protein
MYFPPYPSYSEEEKEEEEKIHRECLANLAENENISLQSREKLCKIVNGVMVDDAISDSSADDLLSAWYNDPTLMNEIYNNLSQQGKFQITPQIILYTYESVDKAYESMTENNLMTGNDRKTIDRYLHFAEDKRYVYFYYNTRPTDRGFLHPMSFRHFYINKYLSSNTSFAIRFSFGGGIYGTHANIIMCKQNPPVAGSNKPVIECELFDPHGQYLNETGKNEESDYIINRVFELLHLLFEPDNYKVIIKNPDEV